MRMLVLALLAFVLLPFLGHAQTSPSAGQRIRVRVIDGRSFVGAVEATSSYYVRLAAPGGPYAIARDAITSMERSTGVRSDFDQYFGTTLLVLAGGVGAAAALAWDPCVGCILHPRTRADAFKWGAVGGGVLGLPLAILVGIASKSERWEPMTGYDAVTMSIVRPPGGGIGVSASIPVGR